MDTRGSARLAWKAVIAMEPILCCCMCPLRGRRCKRGAEALTKAVGLTLCVDPRPRQLPLTSAAPPATEGSICRTNWNRNLHRCRRSSASFYTLILPPGNDTKVGHFCVIACGPLERNNCAAFGSSCFALSDRNMEWNRFSVVACALRLVRGASVKPRH